jgi:hypothetical protein
VVLPCSGVVYAVGGRAFVVLKIARPWAADHNEMRGDKTENGKRTLVADYLKPSQEHNGICKTSDLKLR